MVDMVIGLHDLNDHAKELVSDVISGVEEFNDRVDTFREAHNAEYRALFETVARYDAQWNMSPVFRFQQPLAAEMQYIDELALERPIKGAGYFDRGLPLRRRGIAKGDTWEARKVKTVAQLNKEFQDVAIADVRAGQRELLRALFYNLGWTYKTPEEPGGENFPSTISIVPLANGDSETYMKRNGATGTATMYSGQAAAISDAADPFQAIYDRLATYSPVSDPRIVSFVGDATNKANITNLTNFYPVQNSRYITYGSDVARVGDGIQENLLFGDTVLGEHASGVTVVHWDSLPDDYIVSINLDAPPLGVRESMFEALRGLYYVEDTERFGSEILARWRRQIGVGVVDRTGADILRIGNGTYAVPSGFSVVG